jgi:hypothetical protein
LSQINLENQEITRETLEFGPDVVCFLGPSLTLRDCTLVLSTSARNLVIPQARFIDCTFIIRKELRNFRWDTAHLKGCRFRGRFIGNDFGEWPWSPGQGSIEDCDFSEAQMDTTRFLACDIRTLRFPRWPCYTLFDPQRRWRELRPDEWPGDLGQVVIAGFEKYPPTTVAMTYLATRQAERGRTTPEVIKAILEKLDGVYY